jgi:hypothetical protein
MYSLFPVEEKNMKETLIRTIWHDVTAERGACFHPTIGSVTPNGFIIGHPRA